MTVHGSFVWNELATSDPEACRDFFCELLGWTSRDVRAPGVNYTIFQADGQDTGGMIKMEGEQWRGLTPHWMSYVAVEDVDALAKRVEDLGGDVKLPPTDIPGVGRFCVLSDPTGALLALMTPVQQ